MRFIFGVLKMFFFLLQAPYISLKILKKLDRNSTPWYVSMLSFLHNIVEEAIGYVQAINNASKKME